MTATATIRLHPISAYQRPASPARRRVAALVAIEPSRLALATIGFMPVSLIAASMFDVFGLRDLATHLLAPAVLVAVLLMLRSANARRIVVRGLVMGIVATAAYDLVRFGFLWSGLMDHDPIPHIGSALGLEPAWVFGYLWRYLGNGGGLAIAFNALGLRGVRQGMAFGLVVCGGLLTTLVVAPLGQELLFPLNATTVVMATIGHLVYGAVLGRASAADRFDLATI